MENIVVIKCGGSTLEELSESFFHSIADLKKLGKHPVIVHGGGPGIKKILDALGVQSEFVNGLRKTTPEVMDVVEMVLAGKINKSLVQQLQKAGLNAVGLSGIDGRLIEASPINLEELGLVGEVTNVNVPFILNLIENNMVPVIAPIGQDGSGARYNINADTAAGAVAYALNASQLLFVTDVPGILKGDQLISETTIEEVEDMIKDGIIYGGMIPKVKAAIHSLQGDLDSVMIVDGKNSKIVEDGVIKGTTIRKLAEVK